MNTRLILSGATLALASAIATAQTTAKPTPYEGVSQPPAADTIRATEAAPVTAPAPAAEIAVPAPAAPAAVRPAPAPAGNPDYGIVEGPAPVAEGAPAQAPALLGRTDDPDAGIVTAAPAGNELLAGTPIRARLEQQISSRENGAGTAFTAQVSGDVTQNGRVIIPSGSTIHGRVTHADYGHRISGPASLRLLANEIVLPDGSRYSIRAVPSQTSRSSNTKVNAEGTVQSKDHAKRTAVEYGVGAGSGALVGAEIAGPPGAIVGAGVGVGLVTAHTLLKNNAAVLPSGSEITFGLTQPMALTPITTTAHN
jgi:hypothetical protein